MWGMHGRHAGATPSHGRDPVSCSRVPCGGIRLVLTPAARHKAINSCLSPLVSADGKHIVTVEALGDSANPHPLQERMWKLSGSQCGFCTPGIIMSLYALLRNAASTGSLTVADIELEGALDGNLCRCTGYKPILDAAKSFVGEYIDRIKANGDSDCTQVAEERLTTVSQASRIRKTSSSPSTLQQPTWRTPWWRLRVVARRRSRVRTFSTKQSSI